VAEVTVSVVLPETPPSVAVIAVDPSVIEEVKPWEATALLTVATLVSEELHSTVAVRSCVEASL
jgi:hypothetical protein